MFSRDYRINILISILVLALGACGGVGSGCGCTSQPLPAGGLPKDQTVEGGGQIRVTQAGFQKMTSIIPAVVNDALGGGFCVDRTSILGADVCYTNQGGCNPGCRVNVNVTSTTLRVTNSSTLNVQIRANANASVRINPPIFSACTMTITANNLFADLDIGFQINATTGELEVVLRRFNDYDLSGVNYSGCSVISFLASLVTDLLDSFLGHFIVDLLTPTINDLIQGFLPDPLGIEGMVDVGQLLAGVSPGTEGFMEARMVPGGYVQLGGGGMSLGLITGLNADRDPSTRSAMLDSEPAFCVPPIPAPNFAAPPASLPASPRGTFTLAPAGAFNGSPEPADDLAVGLSETTLDLAGHHLVTSGGMCLGVGTSLIDQLRLGTIGLLVPSLGRMGDGDEPILLITRPQRALDFTIGDGTEASPALTIHIKEFEVDFYAFIYERYTRAFTMSLDLDVGINLEFSQNPGEPAQVTPILVGLESSNIGITVLNNEFVEESRTQLEALLPTVFDLALPLLGNGIGPIDVPDFAGFTLNNLRVQHVTTSQDDFLAIYASLGASQMMRQRVEQYPSLQPVIDQLDQTARIKQWPASVTGARAQLRSVVVPPPAAVRRALVAQRDHTQTGLLPGDELPSVTIDVDSHDASGRELEWSWNLDGGLWRSYSSAQPLVIADRAFAWQGKYTIGLRSRVKGDYRTTAATDLQIPVVIDSSGPKILVDKAAWKDDTFRVPAVDAVYGTSDLVWAYGRVGDDEPWTDWQPDSAIDRKTVEDLDVGGQVQVFVRDPSGNQSVAIARSGFHGQPGESGCNCDSTGGPGTGSLLLIFLTGAALLFRRRAAAVARAVARARTGRLIPMVAIWIGLSVALSLVPGCSCGSNAGHACEISEDCNDIECNQGQIAICFEGECLCTDDVPYGKIGPFSDVAVAANNDVVVSAYAQTHGDLVVARHVGAGRIDDTEWEFVDGVPAGPVALPESDVRGGILAPGPDVGLYSSVAVGTNDVPMATYHDRDRGSLKFAAKYGGTWQSHVIDEGTGEVDPEIGGEQAGLYTSVSVRADDGRPGVAYLAVVSQGGGIVTGEVRFAQANLAEPKDPADWTITVLDTMALPAPDPDSPDPYPLPGGIGLFIEAARDSASNPHVTYYDRQNGDLKLVRWNGANNAFGAPVVLAGASTDDGWYPSVAVDSANVAHVAFQGADHDDVFYINDQDNQRELVDDGYRIVGTTPEGLPKPEFHFVGSDTQIVMTPTGPYVIYQDSTTHELLVASRTGTTWTHDPIAGAEMNFAGAYGFFASAALGQNEIVISTWVIYEQLHDNWVEIFRLPIAPG